MIIGSELRTYLLTLTGITDLIVDRIYAIKLPKGVTFPALTYNIISQARSYSHSGDSNLTQPRIQYSCWGDSYADTKNLASEIVTALSGYKGTAGTAEIGSSFIDNELDMWDEEAKIYHVPVDVLIRYNG